MATVGKAVPQHMTALDRANKIRLARAETKRWLKADGDRKLGFDRAISLLGAELPDHMRTCSVADFLMALPRVGVAIMRKIIRELPIGERKRLDEMTARQRVALQRELRRRRDGRGVNG